MIRIRLKIKEIYLALKAFPCCVSVTFQCTVQYMKKALIYISIVLLHYKTNSINQGDVIKNGIVP